MTIVTYAHRYKRPPRKKQASPLTGPAIVTKHAVKTKAEPAAAAALPSANDARKPALKEMAIVTVTSRKQMRLRRAQRIPDDDDAREATARVKAFLARMIRPGGALPPDTSK